MLSREELIKERLDICKACPLYKLDKFYGPVCDSGKYIKTDGTAWSYIPKPGYKKGCGCHIRHKAGVPSAHCIIGKW